MEVEEEEKKSDVEEQQEEYEDEDSVDDEDEEADTVARKDSVSSADSRTEYLDSEEEEELEEEDDVELEIVKEDLPSGSKPFNERIDEGEEADSESDDTKTKKKPKTEVKKSKKKKKKKKKKKMDGKDVFIHSEPRKRTRTQPNKRKKIRKILTKDKLQAETLQAIREEGERQKRLGLFTREEPSNEAGVSFELLDDDNDTGFPEISYSFDFMDNIDVDIQPLSGEGLEEMLSVPTTSDASGSLGLMELTTENTTTAPETSPVSMEIPKLHQSESNASLTNEVSRLHLLLNTDSSDITVAPSSAHSAVTAGVPTTQNGTPVTTDKPVSQIFLFSPVSESPKISPLPSDGQALPISTIGSLLSSSNVQSSSSSSSILFQTLSMTSQSMLNSTSSGVGFDGHKPLASQQYTGFSKPTSTSVSSKPAVSQPSEVICISSESSDDERVKKQQQQPIQKSAPIDTISISSGSESSNDDVIFAGTDDNEIAEQDPDVNNSGMHVNDIMNQPDLDGRVLVNKNRPPDEPEIYLAPRLARAVLPHQIGGIRFMFDNIVESLEHYKKSNGFGCILAHSMGLGKTLQVISFIDVFLRYTEGKTALCVVPVNTLLNWVAEFEMWLPATKDKSENPEDGETTKPRTFKVRLLSDQHKTTEARANVISSWKTDGGVLLMGYEMFRLLTNQKSRRRKKKKQRNGPPGGIIETIDLDEEDKISELTAGIYENLVNPGPDLIVCDEGHRIKNSHASISQALKQIATRRRIVLTGYPLQNNLMEYWCMVDFVRPNFLGAKQEFSNMFERPISNGQCADSNEGDIRLMRFRSHVLHSLLKGFVQRRSHSVLKNSLPPKEEYVLMVRLSQWQKKLYNNFIKLQKEQGSGSWCSALNPIKAFSICCKIWNHPDVLYRAVIRKSLEQQSNDQNSLLDIDLDLPEAVMESILKKARRKREARAEKNLEAVPGSSGTLVQSVGFSPFGDEKEKGMNYDWAIDLLEDYSSNKIEFSGKMLILMQIIEHSVNSGDKILVFSQSLTTLTLMEEFLAEIDVPNPPNGPQFQRKWRRNESYLRLDGNTSTTDREKMIQLFNDKNNNTIHLFLLSTRAGCLGINLVGANRVVVFDISWNPCHDAQAVCRVYRYGQRKKCSIYRLICDQSMEKKIYDRQINKQGMADRVVDELNPIQSLERQDITKLLIYNDEELPPPEIDEEWLQECNDETLKHTCKVYGHWLTRKPFHHESLLMECKGSRLTKAEKRAAQKGYEQEKRASNSCTYSRPSYTNFYAAAGYPEKTNARSKFGVLSKSSSTANKPVANVRPIQSTPYPMQPAGSSGLSSESGDSQIISHLQRAGISVRKTVASQDIPLPQSSVGPNSKPLVSAGESFYMITGTKGLYIGTATGRIFALRSQKTEENKPLSPSMSGPGGQMVTTRERESQIIKTAFNAMVRRNQGPRQPMRYQYSPNQPIRAGGFPSNFGAMPGNTNLVDLMTGQNFGMNQQNPLLTQQRPIMSPQIMLSQQNNMLNQQNFPTLQQNQMLGEQVGIMTQQNGGMTQQNGGMTQQIGNMTQPYEIVPQQNGVSQDSNQGSSQQNLPQSTPMEQNQVIGMPQTNMMQQNFATHPQLMNYAMMNQQNFAAPGYGMTPNFFTQNWANQSGPMFQSPVVTNGLMQQTNNPNMMQQKDTSIVTSQTNDESQSILPTMSLEMMEETNENDIPTDETLTQQVTTSLPSLSSLLVGQQNLQRLLTEDGPAGSPS